MNYGFQPRPGEVSPGVYSEKHVPTLKQFLVILTIAATGTYVLLVMRTGRLWPF